MNRILFVLLDGLAASTARQCLSYPQALEEAGQARYSELECFLPPLSRPTYATLLCGLPPIKSGIMHNDDKRACPAPTIFASAQKAGLVTAAAAYYWMSELCNVTPFDPACHRLTNAPGMPIEHGLFYSNDDYPDNELFNDAAALFQGFEPDLLMIHTMGIDYAGHCRGAHSHEYRNAARRVDGLLARWLPQWQKQGYSVLVTSDHGMNEDHSHNDNSEITRRVPFWLFGPAWENLPMPANQTEIANLVLQGLGLDGPASN